MKKFLAGITLVGMISALEASGIRGTVTSTLGKLQDAVVYIERVKGRSFFAPQEPKPFVWTKRADQIIEKVNRCKAVIDTLH